MLWISGIARDQVWVGESMCRNPMATSDSNSTHLKDVPKSACSSRFQASHLVSSGQLELGRSAECPSLAMQASRIRHSRHQSQQQIHHARPSSLRHPSTFRQRRLVVRTGVGQAHLRARCRKIQMYPAIRIAKNTSISMRPNKPSTSYWIAHGSRKIVSTSKMTKRIATK